MVGVGSIIGGEHAAFGGSSFADRAQVVQNPSGPTKGSEHEVAFAFLNGNVLHGHYRKACPALPCFPGVAAHKKPCFGAQVNQRSLSGVLLDAQAVPHAVGSSGS